MVMCPAINQYHVTTDGGYAYTEVGTVKPAKQMHPWAHFTLVNSATQSSSGTAPDTSGKAAELQWVAVEIQDRRWELLAVATGLSQGHALKDLDPACTSYISSIWPCTPKVILLNLPHSGQLTPVWCFSIASPKVRSCLHSLSSAGQNHGDFNDPFLNDPGFWSAFWNKIPNVNIPEKPALLIYGPNYLAVALMLSELLCALVLLLSSSEKSIYTEALKNYNQIDINFHIHFFFHQLIETNSWILLWLGKIEGAAGEGVELV